MLTIRVETIDFDTQACVLRVKGRNVEENEYVKVCTNSCFAVLHLLYFIWRVTKTSMCSLGLYVILQAKVLFSLVCVCYRDIGYPVTGHKTDDRFINAVTWQLLLLQS